MWTFSRRSVPAVLLAGAITLGACDDGLVTPSPSVPTGPSRSFQQATSPPAGTDVGLYWHHGDTLWVYDKRPEIGIGVSHLDGGYGGLSTPLQYAQVQQLKMRLVRIAIYWPEVDPDGTGWGNYNQATLDFIDYQVIKARQAGLEPVVVVVTQAYVGNEPSVFQFNETAEANPTYPAFARFMSHMAARYTAPDRLVRYWQLFNEMDAGWTRVFGAEANLDKLTQGIYYAQMLKQAYPAIKSANPGAWVIAGGLTGLGGTGKHSSGGPRDYTFLLGMYDGGAKHFFDFLAVHTYGGKGPAPVDSAGVQLTRHLDWRGDSGRPIWVTEFGTSAELYVTERGYYPHAPDGGYQPDGVTFDSAQVNFWRGALRIHQTSGHFVKMIGYQLVSNDGDIGGLDYGLDSTDYRFSLVRPDNVTLKPVFDSIAAGSFNSPVHGVPSRTVDVDVTWTGRYPVGYAYTLIGSNVLRIHNVPVDNLQPTKIAFSGTQAPAGARICYQAYSADIGWSSTRCDWQVAGTEWQSRRMEAVRIWLESPQAGVGICYRVHRTQTAWEPEVCDGAVAGTGGDGLRMEAVEIRLTNPTPGMRVCYQAHNTTSGWEQGTRCDGVTAGTTGLSRAIEAIQIKLTS